MAFRSLREFITFLESKGQLRRIKAEVQCELEITEIADRVAKQQGPALLFENVAGYNIPVVANLFGSTSRISWALDAESLDHLEKKVASLLNLAQGPMPTSMMDKFKILGDLAKLSGCMPKTVSKAPCQEVVLTGEHASLDAFPILKCWPGDAGRFITLPLVITADPITGKRNVGMYRMQVYDRQTTGMHWHLHKTGADHFRKAREKRSRLPVAVALGADPATIYAATAPLPPHLDEFMFAGFMRGEGVELVRARTVDLDVPAHSEIVLEGYVDPDERRMEGPFGDHTGYYSPADEYPVFHLTCVTHRSQPIYPATVVGKPPMEDYYIGKATERLFLPLIRMILPEVVDINMPAEGVFQNLVIVAIDKTYPGQAHKVMHAIWGMMQMMRPKMIVVVDRTVPPQDLSQVLWRVANNVDPRRDVVIADGPLDDLDHSAPQPRFGSKMGVDATAKLPEEGHPRPWPPDAVMSEEVKRLVSQKWSSYGL